jgi:hypothetical protein
MVDIEYVDGRTESVGPVDDLRQTDGVLNLWHVGNNSTLGTAEHVGSFPLVNIRKWKRREGTR